MQIIFLLFVSRCTQSLVSQPRHLRLRKSFGSTKMAIGDYPAEYNPKVHGPYDPARYYGKPDTPFGQVKVGELGAWFARRNKTPRGVIAATSRAWWRWQHKYMLPRKAGIAPYVQFMVGAMGFFYIINYAKLKTHRLEKYHW